MPANNYIYLLMIQNINDKVYLRKVVKSPLSILELEKNLNHKLSVWASSNV
jgi:hypothetical protein